MSKRWGRLQENNRGEMEVMEIFPGEKLFPITEELRKTWVELPPGVDAGWLRDGDDFVSPPVLEPEEDPPLHPDVEALLNAIEAKVGPLDLPAKLRQRSRKMRAE